MSRHYDLIIVGGGWAGAVVAAEACQSGLRTLVLEKGETTGLIGSDTFYRPRAASIPPGRLPNPVHETFTLRHDDRSPSFPMRTLGAFLAGRGLGGAGMLWGGISARFHPHGFRSKSLNQHLLDQVWAKDFDYLDWPISYADIEPDYCWAEQILGVATTAGLAPERYPRSKSLPGQPLVMGQKAARLAEAASAIGLQVTEMPAAVSFTPYLNPLGVKRGVNSEYGYSLATPLNSLWPFALASGNLDVRTGHVHRVLHQGGRANGVLYTDAAGEERRVSSTSVALCGWTLNNVRLLLLSNIGKPYSPESGGNVGRFYANHIGASAQGFLSERLLDAKSSDAAGWANSDFDPGDPSADYIGGARIHVPGLTNLWREAPTVPSDGPQWGKNWQDALVAHAGRAVSVGMLGEVVPHRHRYLDLDTTYRDAWGDPLLRINFDWLDNDRRMVRTVGSKLDEILQQAGATLSKSGRDLPERYDTVHYTNSHATGGAVMGDDPATSVVDPDLQSWDARGLWVVGASAFPTSPAPNPTLTVIALARRAARALVKQNINSKIFETA